MKPLRILLLALTALMLNGCDDTPKVRMVGSAAPDFTVTDADRTVALHDFHGRILVLNFWATYCAPCVEEMPSLMQLQKRMGQKITVLAVSTDKKADDYHNFLTRYHIDLLTVRDPNEKSSTLYGTTGIPETFIIDASGTIRRKFIGPFNWTSPDIVEYLNKL